MTLPCPEHCLGSQAAQQKPSPTRLVGRAGWGGVAASSRRERGYGQPVTAKSAAAELAAAELAAQPAQGILVEGGWVNYCADSTSSCTRPTPLALSPIWEAAAADRSITRPWPKGPRSLMRTTTERPVERLVTRTWVPKGSVR